VDENIGCCSGGAGLRRNWFYQNRKVITADYAAGHAVYAGAFHANRALPARHIEVLGLEEGVDLLLNEEGKLIQLQPNRRLGMDILCGVFYVLGVDETRGDFCSLPENMINKYMKIFETPEDIDPSEVANTLGMTFFSI